MLNKNIQSGAFIKHKQHKYFVKNYKEGLNQLINIVHQTQQKQRYKGLGEMNPKQLWDTTMNPSNRRMLNIKVHDFDEANKIFSILMGDNVLARKNFIKNNAILVNNLDI